MATGVNIKKTVEKNSANVGQQPQNNYSGMDLGQSLSNLGDRVTGYMYGDIAKQAINDRKNQQRLNRAKREQTIGGNNYYLEGYEQGQLNSLNGTGHVAGFPQGLNNNIIQPVTETTTETPVEETQPEQTNTPTTQPTTQSGNNQTIQPSVSTPSDEQQRAEDIANWQKPDSWNKPEVDNAANEQAIINMQNDLATQGGKVYGKVSESSGEPTQGINTLNDPNSIENITAQSRVANLKALQLMNSQDIAESLVDGYSPYGDQAMRDLMQYNPTKYAEVQQYMKEKLGQEAVNSIMSNGTISSTSTTQSSTDAVNNGITNRANGVTDNPEAASQATTNLMNTMASNQTANSATQEMLNINSQLADLQYKLEHVQEEAKAGFKGDVPQYLVDAKASNLTQKYQAQISKLESRYNAALDLYKTELSNAQRQAEMQLKYLDYQRNLTNDQRDQWYKSQSLVLNNIKRVDGVAYQVDPSTGTYKKLTDSSAYDTYNKAVTSTLQYYLTSYGEGVQCGLQCEGFTDNFTQATAGVRMTGASPDGWTTAAEKLSYVNDLVPQVGSVIVAVGGAYDSTYGHTMLITGYDPETGIMNLMWSNTNGDRTVHTSRATLADIQRNSVAAGIWNPYITAQGQSIAASGGYTQYGMTITPMTAVFDEMIAKGKDTDTIAKAEQAYTYLYEMVNDGSLQMLIESGDIGKIMAYMSKGNFGEKDDEGAKFAERLKTYIEKRAAKELMGGYESLKALNKLVQLVEVKLRKESGAAINSSERLTNFEMFLPQAGESVAYQREKMASRDNLILRNLRSAGLSTINNYIPVFSIQARQIWED